MNLYVSDFLDGRIDDIMKDLRKTDGEYANAMEKTKDLYSNIESIIKSKKEILITGKDCSSFEELLDQEFTRTAIMQQKLYKQGYLDCVNLMKMLGVLQ